VAEIRAFRGLRYNQQQAGSIASLVCPPYDVISPEQQKAYYELNEYNAIRLEHGFVFPTDNVTDNRDTRAAGALRRWVDDGILRFDQAPALYVHDHWFGSGLTSKRRGLLCRVRLEPPENRTVLPHENTVTAFKADRLQLLRACKANISPIFCLYNDRGGQAVGLLEKATSRRPDVEFTSSKEEQHQLWVVTDPNVLRGVSAAVSPHMMYIADGHHRYETCQAYKEERQKAADVVTGEEGFNFMLMALVEFSDPGLVVFPIHRVINGLPEKVLSGIRSAIEDMFVVKHLPCPVDRPIEKLVDNNVLFAVVGLIPGKVSLARFKPGTDSHQFMPRDRSPAYRKLPVSLVHHLVLDRFVRPLEGHGIVTYTHDAVEAAESVETGKAQFAVILGQTPVETIKAIADAGDKMPGKSTYFFPKLPTGLVFNSLED